MSIARLLAIGFPMLIVSGVASAELRHPLPPAAPFVVPDSIEAQVRCDNKTESRIFKYRTKKGPAELRLSTNCPHVFATEKHNGIVLSDDDGRMSIGVSAIGTDEWKVINVDSGNPIAIGGESLSIESWAPSALDAANQITE